MTANQKFLRQDILIDGREFFNCEFIQCRIVFRGTGPVQFEQCVFTECQWVFDGPAENTLFFLSALATDLGPEAAAMVENMLNGIATGQIEKVLTQTRPAVAV
ncbi:MAG: hypothetical protein ACRDJC_03835 [Thermomicrobiales bacterium]